MIYLFSEKEVCAPITGVEEDMHVLYKCMYTFEHNFSYLSAYICILSLKCVCVCVRYGGALQNLTLKLPVTINKFFQPTEMTSHDFFQRWKQLSQ